MKSTIKYQLVHLLAKNELLNGEIFYSLREAQILIEQWRKHYSRKRPHCALGHQRQPQKPLSRWTKGRQCTNNQIGPHAWASSMKVISFVSL